MSDEYRFQAFISYSHDDEATATWLHRELERFVLPKDVAAQPVAGISARRLGAIFRDSDELAASKDLGEDIKDALRASRSLIVLCSPGAAQSKWVAKEIAYFRDELGRDRVFAALARGEPHTHDGGAFPALLVENGREPLAADIRGAKPSARRDGVVRLAAGLCDLDYDDLRRRELARARAAALRNAILAAGAGALALAAVGASVAALQANARLTTSLAAESEARQQAQAALASERRAREAERIAAQSASTLEQAGESLFDGLNETAIGFARSLITAREPGASTATVILVDAPNEETELIDPGNESLPQYWLRCPRNLADCFSPPQHALSRAHLGVIGVETGSGRTIDAAARRTFQSMCNSFVGPASDPVIGLCAGRPVRARDADPEEDRDDWSLAIHFTANLQRGFALFTYESHMYCGSGGCFFPWDLWVRSNDGRFHRVNAELRGADRLALVFREERTEIVGVGISQFGASIQIANVARYGIDHDRLALARLNDFRFIEQHGEFGTPEGEYEVQPMLTVCQGAASDHADDPCAF